MNSRAVLKKKIISTFSKSGLRNSSKRNAVVEAFVSSNKHLNTEELYGIVKKSKTGIGFVTVYRTLKLLVEYGFAREVDFKDGFTRYEIKDELSSQHDHLICVKCGHITEFKDGEIEILKRRARSKTGFNPLYHRLEIFGICRLCRGKDGYAAE
ncbi:MAG: transcriptional repressor [Deltaproteobacteria bacterium]|nr:transcriptional repressor [Deltaproteobacteria bacterium]MCL5277078.1 transcriptional repressor [Deltaproteobacteria bacterium]